MERVLGVFKILSLRMLYFSVIRWKAYINSLIKIMKHSHKFHENNSSIGEYWDYQMNKKRRVILIFAVRQGGAKIC